MFKTGFFFYLCILNLSVYALSPESLVSQLSSPESLSAEWHGRQTLHAAEMENRLVSPADLLPLKGMSADLNRLLQDGKVCIVDTPKMYQTLSFPFLYHQGFDCYKVFLRTDEKLYLPLDFLMNPAYRPFLNSLLKICFSSEENSFDREKDLKTLERRIYTYWAVDQEVALPLRPRLYAQTCKSILQNNPRLDFYDSVVHVLPRVLRSVYVKSRMIESLKAKGSVLLSSNIHLPQSEEWIDALLQNPGGNKEVLCVHQAYFHEGEAISESAEALWRLGAGSLQLGIDFLEQLHLSLNSEVFPHEEFKIRNLIRFLKEDGSPSSRKRKMAITLMNAIDPSDFDSAQTGLLELGRRMIQPGFLDHWFSKMTSRDIYKTIPSFDSVKLVVDTRFDLIRPHASDLKNRKDRLSLYLLEILKEGNDPLFELIRKRFQELSLENPGQSFKLEKVTDHCPIPSDCEDLRLKVNEMLQDERMASGTYEIMEGQLYSRYCGLLLELLGSEFLSNLGLEILNTGLELSDDNGIYFTELDGVVRNPQTGRTALVEAKSMRTRLSKAYVLSNKVIYKLKTYHAKKELIQKKLSTSFEDAFFIIDTGGNKGMEHYLKDQEKFLEAQFGFPIKFIALDMAKKVASVTGYEGSLKKAEREKTDPVPVSKIQVKKKEKSLFFDLQAPHPDKISQDMKADYRPYRRLAKQELRILLAQYQNGNLQDKAA